MCETIEIWVYTEQSKLLPELIGGARQVAGDLSAQVCCLITGSHEMAENAGKLGADRILWLGDPLDCENAPRLVEDYLDTIETLVVERQPLLFLFGATRRGRVIAGRLATRMGTCVIPDILSLEIENGEILGRHFMFAGGAQRLEKTRRGLTIATVGAGVFEASRQAGNPGNIEDISYVKPEVTCSLLERKPRPVVSTNLAAAKRVVCPGLGLSKQEELTTIEELANALQAEIGCSRPLSEGLNWLPRERYIGVSGVNLKADLYIGVGISGQAQHMVGVNGCRVIVAINKDENAPIFRQADYAIVADLNDIVPALTRALQQGQA